ncbi:type IV toxin-antitoxin system AbiEi family antitoxin domain-containing protein [Prosthecodimorpha staleyi]|uniref:Type IV toxin-antitoxin system AbiEi family antitoxin domain-containing protein n=1 Tax=Prosthecodimorpha staleyi TaxID=2840188 RepID=A0A947D1P6_9HYPH|nr:type IV toxin-antitoxin system AbiEi family antitoxin domain-containing protein [Prosthecodimorpha staleyi]MBT9289150.1 type IV toxin-antitoxin system AbiEi family antitoxin domain-containing protein [Prosthecodimorpha staleyi]
MGHNSYDSADDPALAAVQAAFETDMRVLVGKFELYARGNPRFGQRLFHEVVHPAVERMEAVTGDPPAADETFERAERAEARGRARPAEPTATVVKLDRRRAPSTAAHSGPDVPNFILDVLCSSDGVLSVEDIQSHLGDFDPPISPANLSVILHRMVRSGHLHRPGRGLYAPGPRASDLNGDAGMQRP